MRERERKGKEDIKIYFQRRGDKNFWYYRGKEDTRVGSVSSSSYKRYSRSTGCTLIWGKWKRNLYRPPIVTVVERWIKVTMRLQRSWEFRDNGVGQNAGPILSSDQVSTYDREEAPFIKEIIFDPCYALEKKGKDTAHVQSTPLFITLRFVSLCKLKLIIPLLKRRKYNEARIFLSWEKIKSFLPTFKLTLFA